MHEVVLCLSPIKGLTVRSDSLQLEKVNRLKFIKSQTCCLLRILGLESDKQHRNVCLNQKIVSGKICNHSTLVHRASSCLSVAV